MKTIRLVFAVLFTAVGIIADPAFAGDRVLYYHNDALGSPVVMTDSAGNVVWRADYEPFGEISALIDNLQAPNTHQFIGKETDPETSLHYLGARYYDGNIGRFLSVDPALRLKIPYVALTTPQLLNSYGYSANNPYRFIDRDGKFIQLLPLVLAVGGAFATNAILPSTVNAPSNNQNFVSAQTVAEFVGETALGATFGFVLGKVVTGLISGEAIRFAQKGISSTFRHGEFAGKTIEEVAAGLRSGAIKADQLTILVIEREGVTYTLNNRSLMALRQAGLDPTRTINVTGNSKFEELLTQRLNEIGGKAGANFVPEIRE